MKMLVTGALRVSKAQLAELESLGVEFIFVQDERKCLEIDVSDIEAVVCNSLFLYNDISRFTKLKLIQVTSAGLDRLPLDYIKQNGIILYNAADIYSKPMAEWAVLKILEIYKKTKEFVQAQQKQEWKKQRNNLLELTGKYIAIIGYGNVGIEIAKRLKGFGVYIIGVGRREKNVPLVDEYYSVKELDEVLSKSDIVVITLPHTADTHHLIDFKKIGKMKDKSVLINVSRGGVVDESCLIEALYRGKFLGVALDVFEQEPLKEGNPLWNFETVTVTPHNSYISDEINDRLFNLIKANLKAHMK